MPWQLKYWIVVGGIAILVACIQDPDTFDASATDAGPDVFSDVAPSCSGGLDFCGHPMDGTAKCTDLSTDPDHCGSCDNRCQTGADEYVAVCVDGSCEELCDARAGYYSCADDDQCISLNTHPDHCGGCDNRCPSGGCTDGQCSPFSCDPSDAPFGGGTGLESDPFTICTPEQLLRLAEHHEPWAVYALSTDIDLAQLQLEEGDSFDSIANFEATLDGYGLSIENFGATDDDVTEGSPTVLFEQIAEGATIRNLTLRNFQVHDPTIDDAPPLGGLVRTNFGVIADVTLEAVEVEGQRRVGALVGRNHGQLHNIHSDTDTVVSGRDFEIGGLVGEHNGSIAACRAAGVVQAGQIVDDDRTRPRAVGGLVGIGTAGSSIVDSRADVDIAAEGAGDDTDDWNGRIGGLVGHAHGLIDGSSASGAVTTTEQRVGGLVGRLDPQGRIQNSAATGPVTGAFEVGGLVGYIDPGEVAQPDTPLITGSFAVGEVTGITDVGGLIGRTNNTSPTASDCYSTGAAVADESVAGGLVGTLSGPVLHCYSVGAVQTPESAGGLVGRTVPDALEDAVTNSYWDEDRSGQTDSGGGGEQARSTEEFSVQPFFEGAGWDFDDTWLMPETTDIDGDDFVRPRLQWEFQ